MDAEPMAGDEPGAPMRYAVALRVLMCWAKLDLWQTFADRRQTGAITGRARNRQAYYQRRKAARKQQPAQPAEGEDNV